MTLYRVFDAAYPPSTPPPGCHGVLGYIGGTRATHTWPATAWLPFRGLRQFPCWVPSTTDAPGATAQQAAARARALGWAPGPTVGPRVIVCDLEALEDRAWYSLWAAEITAAGFVPVAYGSLSTVLANAASDVWAAAWDDSATLPAGQTIHGHQYQADVPYSGTQVDFSVVDDWMIQRGGVGSRHV